MDPGSLADWISAVATVAATVAAVFAGFYAYKALGIEQAGDAERHEDRRRAQAEQINAWAEHLRPGSHGSGPTGSDPNRVRLVVKLQNLSNAPVYAVRLGFILGRRPREGEVPDGVNPPKRPLYADWEFLLPPTDGPLVLVEFNWRAVQAWQDWRLKQEALNHMDARPYVELTFQDGSGTWWLRDARGRLTDISENDAVYRFEYPNTGGTAR
ncbi:hypothetical protein [Acidipropionibacterium virtanenii]|uniref:Uncharacterized protein n=1 Tax=Acidipropionibacterium virtanenii TaxID=2057246 RepID=A0A344UQM8_9ACTN|nr:hypothetical protein [Acidipropionibacterium virtanenii]AXE37576.1 hypothetical protein JS278_00379 [Acidipropionibacterium virtanenii]